MRIAATISRYLLGLIFVVFGANGFLHFIPTGTMPGLAGQFLTVLTESHFTVPIFLTQLAGGILLLINRYVPLGLVLLGPVIVNIFFFHALMAPSGLPLAVVVIVLWVIVALENKRHLAGIFAAK